MARRRTGLFVWASRQAPADAKAAALRFLARRLDTLLSTTGHFAANVRLPIAFAGNPYMDVDLFDATDNLIILLDDTSSLADPDAPAARTTSSRPPATAFSATSPATCPPTFPPFSTTSAALSFHLELLPPATHCNNSHRRHLAETFWVAGRRRMRGGMRIFHFRITFGLMGGGGGG